MTTDQDEKPRDITPLRQPMVTSLGIIMGFLLNFLAGWATADDGDQALQTPADYAVAITLLLSIAMMCMVLFRLLDIRHPDHVIAQRYINTFYLYCGAIVLAFAGVGAGLLL